MSGSQLVNKMRRWQPRLPVVFISGHANDVLEEHDVKREWARFIPKPIRLDQLMVTLRELLDERT